MTALTAIYVTVETKERLASLAALTHDSLSEYVTRLSWRVWREAVILAEREATKADLANPGAMREYEIWEGTLADGID
ncbi:MAG: hypothetical protein LBM23_06275 [Propionibacteriaceae bacterium]|jgi:hypothetical protein|nr:hypothetical protein [Propionibacteriaceae bacterium]